MSVPPVRPSPRPRQPPPLVLNEADANAVVKIEEAGIEVMQADDILVAELKAVADPLEAASAEQAQARGFDGAAALKAIREATGVRVSA